ncbi:MAG: glycoside hydrolase family 73 protein [Saprospiraceae bacterium]
MKQQQFLIPSLLLLMGLFSSFDEKSVPDVSNYINKYKSIAIEEMYRSGIPASITLAQGLHESGIGKGQLAVNSNNHFGIKCKKNWEGESFYWKDDDFDRNGNLTESCFRVYPSVQQSYRDHTDFLLKNKRYKVLFSYDRTDYVNWAKGLKSCGYATDKLYADKLIKTIKRYNLSKFDTLAPTSFVTEEEDEADEASDEVFGTITTEREEYTIPEEEYSIPKAEAIPQDYERHMFDTKEESIPAPKEQRPNYILSVPVTNSNEAIVETTTTVTAPASTEVKEEETSMLIPETATPIKTTTVTTSTTETAPMAPRYNIAAFSNTATNTNTIPEVVNTPVTTTPAPKAQPIKKRDRLIQMVRKPRISRKRNKH